MALAKLHQTLVKETATRESTYGVTELTQADFDEGTYIIENPGVYRLTENISFNPNRRYDYSGGGRVERMNHDSSNHLDWMPDYTNPDQVAKYGDVMDPPFTLGFFAAVIIRCRDVVLDLNGYTLEQHQEHALQQRFYSLIELTDQPFPPRDGPVNFGDKVNSGNHVTVKNGVLGQSAHHAIHGNSVSYILLEGLTFRNFELAAISLNVAHNVVIKNVTIEGNRQDVPVLGTYSASRFILPFMRQLVDGLAAGAVKTDGEDKLLALEAAVEGTFDEIIGLDGANESGETTHALYRNDARNLDGNSYGILIHPKLNVDDFALNRDLGESTNIVIEDVVVSGMRNTINEVIGLTSDQTTGTYGGAMHDTLGAVFPVRTLLDENGHYSGTVLSDVQLFITEYGPDVNGGKSSIGDEIVAWSKGGVDIADIIAGNEYINYYCNGDSMNHMNKGLLGFKLDGVKNMLMNNCRVVDIETHGRMGSDICGPYDTSHSKQTATVGYSGANIRGFSLAACCNVEMNFCKADGVYSVNGRAYGCHIFNGSQNVSINNLTVGDVRAGRKVGDVWLGVDSEGNDVAYTADLPNRIPIAYFLKVEESCRLLKCENLNIEPQTEESLETVYVSIDTDVRQLVN